ncbi:MAG: MFS transporter [Firmicutes bacterium]|jgi:GPH family glycoside/pentoside/hexuronide:cation symporter|nr:MFS transporter [Bacillota bacterium]
MTTETLSFKAKFSYGLADFGFSIAFTIPAFFLMIFLTDVAGIPPALVGTVLLVAKAWDAVIDPFIGHLSDRLQTGWGRRRPFLLWFAVPFGFSFYFLWLVPAGTSLFWQSLIVLGVVIFFITNFSLLSVPYNSLAPEMTRDYNERTRLNAYRMFFSIIGGLVAVILPAYFLGLSEDLRYGYRVMGLSLGVFIALLPLAAFWGTKEKQLPGEQEISFGRGVRLVLGNRPFILSLLTYLATWVAIDIISSVFLYYLKYWLGIGEDSSNTIFGVLFIVAAFFLPFWVRISEKSGKVRAYILAHGFLAVILLALIFLPPEANWLVYLFAALAGIGISAAHVIPISILPDAIDYDQLHSGYRQEGIYFGLVNFIRQLATSGALFFVGLILQWTGYVPNAAQTETALWGIRLLIGLLPGILLLLGILALRKYPIDREYHQEIIAQLAARETAAEKERL